MMDFRDNLEKCQQYINALEEERKKIQVFQRELPLCVELVSQAIEACKQQLCEATTVTTPTTECMNGHSECSEQTTSDGPILEEFIPIKRSNSIDEDEDEDEHESDKTLNNNLDDGNEKSGKKSDWLRSVQLWNQTPDPTTPKQDEQPKKVAVIEVKSNGNGGAFHPFEKEKNINNGNRNENIKQTNISTCSSAQDTDMTPNNTNSACKKEKEGQRKSRRCWSPELHRRFVNALQQLGGSHVATPKQIRELMKVDGLTNDEVKSHLQKYRLHTRRPSSGIPNNTITNPQTPQFVVVGGIWVPPPGDNAAPSGIYAPIATMATPPTMHQTSAHSQQQTHSRSNSPATSSSTHTSSASHTH